MNATGGSAIAKWGSIPPAEWMRARIHPSLVPLPVKVQHNFPIAQRVHCKGTQVEGAVFSS